MGSKMEILILGLLAMLFFISSQVAARDLKEGDVVRATNQVGGGGGGYFGVGPGGVFPRPRGGFYRPIGFPPFGFYPPGSGFYPPGSGFYPPYGFYYPPRIFPGQG